MTAAADVTRRSPRRVFRDRREAGRVLAELLAAYRDQPDVIVLGLARGGLPVAWEVAAALHAPLDAFVVRKLGAPGHDEFAVGALASGGRVVVNDDVVRGLRITPQQLRDIAEREGRELLRRESAYRGERPPTDITGKTVIVVDDGLATGASMFAAVQALRDAQPAQIVIAVPAAPESTCREFAGLVDDVVCATMPTPFLAVGESFWDFRQVTDEEVRRLLATPTAGGLQHISSGVFLLKASVRELRECVGSELLTEPEQLAAAHELIDRGRAEVVVVSLGSQGALLATRHASHRFSSIPMTAVSGVGAGDAMVAAITVGLSRGWSLIKSVRLGNAAGAAMLLTPGTAACNRDDVERFFELAAEPTEVGQDQYVWHPIVNPEASP